jgi:hypothetical protein
MQRVASYQVYICKEVTIPPESMEYFQELQPNLRNESFLQLAFDWEGSGSEIPSHDQITATLLNNLQRALRRYVQQAVDLIASKWAGRGLHPSVFASRMESAGEALEHDVFQMLRDGISALAHGASPYNLEQALSGQVRGDIARKIELYRRNAQLVGLCELPEQDDVVAEYRAMDEYGSPPLEGVSTSPLPAREQTDTARADSRGSHDPEPASVENGDRASSSSDAIPMESPTRIEFEAGLAAAEVTLNQDLKEHGPNLEIARKYVVNATLTLARCILTPNCVEPYGAIQRAYDFAEWFAGEAIKPAWVWICVFSEMNTSGKLKKYDRDGSIKDVAPEGMSKSEIREWHSCLYGVAHEALDEFVVEFWKERLKYFSTAAESSKAASRAASETGGITTTGHSAGAGLPDFPERAAWLRGRLAERAWNRNDPLKHRGPDPKTIDKILRGETVREDVLEKLATSLSKKGKVVDLLNIPRK